MWRNKEVDCHRILAEGAEEVKVVEDHQGDPPNRGMHMIKSLSSWLKRRWACKSNPLVSVLESGSTDVTERWIETAIVRKKTWNNGISHLRFHGLQSDRSSWVGPSTTASPAHGLQACSDLPEPRQVIRYKYVPPNEHLQSKNRYSSSHLPFPTSSEKKAQMQRFAPTQPHNGNYHALNTSNRDANIPGNYDRQSVASFHSDSIPILFTDRTIPNSRCMSTETAYCISWPWNIGRMWYLQLCSHHTILQPTNQYHKCQSQLSRSSPFTMTGRVRHDSRIRNARSVLKPRSCFVHVAIKGRKRWLQESPSWRKDFGWLREESVSWLAPSLSWRINIVTWSPDLGKNSRRLGRSVAIFAPD